MRGLSILPSTLSVEPTTTLPSIGLVIMSDLLHVLAWIIAVPDKVGAIVEPVSICIVFLSKISCPFRERKNGFCLMLSSISSLKLEREVPGFMRSD